MNYQNMTLKLPPLTDEAAASLYKFIEALMHAVDDHYYLQIHQYYAQQLDSMILDAQSIQEPIEDPPF